MLALSRTDSDDAYIIFLSDTGLVDNVIDISGTNEDLTMFGATVNAGSDYLY